MDVSTVTSKKFTDELAKATGTFIKEALKIARKNNIGSLKAMRCICVCIADAISFGVYKKLEKEIEEEEKKCLS